MISFDESYFEAEYRDGFYIEPMMKRAWAAQLEILQVIDAICKRHNIKYFAELGTLLGAVRHKGYIPWDDDLDLGMLREDYQKFISVAKYELPEGYDLLNVYEYPEDISFLSRIVNSRQISFEEEHLRQFHGFPYVVGIDIFVTDYIPHKKEDEKRQCELINIVRGTLQNMTLEAPKDPEVLTAVKDIQKLCNVKFDRATPLKTQLARLVDKLSAMYTADEADDVGFIVDLANGKDYHIKKEAYAETIMMPFENITIPVPIGYDEVLKVKYGENYMTPVRGASSHDYPFYRIQQRRLVEYKKCQSKEKQPNFSVCVVAKNAEKTIERCLQCLLPYNAEILVADMESTDRTRELASKYTTFTYIAPDWGYSWAKTMLAEKATNDYVLVIHADDYIASIDVEKLSIMLEEEPDKVGLAKCYLTSFVSGSKQENVEWKEGIFSKEKYHSRGRVYEQVMTIDGSQCEYYQAPIIILRDESMRTEEERKACVKEQISALHMELEYFRQQMQDEIEDVNRSCRLPRVYYHLGKNYYLAGEYSTACEYFSEGLGFDLNPAEEYVIDMVESYGYAMLNSGQAETALFFENIYEEFGDSADFKFLMGLIYMNNEMFDEAVGEFLKATEYEESRKAGANSYLAFFNAGVIFECCGMLGEARELYTKCGDYEPAIARLQNLG